ncbi:MAG TPA: hypothetical protein G4N96_07340 [Chloroflexi bacterium]|nr:MAG: hypothetical protein B6243_08295 [Anaerolineaceae bacterium 4572_5.2]HEY84909.1 hypothetical protein [Chloroflexota bacterium]
MKKRNLSLLYVILFAIIVSLAACSASDSQGEPPVEDTGSAPTAIVTSPLADEVLALGQAVKVASTSQGERGIARVELVINGEALRVDANPDPQPNTPYLVAQPWMPETPGSYRVLVRAYNTANIAGESEAVLVKVEKLSAQGVETASLATAPAATASVATATATPSAPVPTLVPPAAAPTASDTTFTSPLAEPTPAPLIDFTPTGFEPQGNFAKIWDSLGGGDSRLGYPLAPEIDGRNFAYQYFDSGVMYWWDNPDGPNFIWAMASASQDDFWQGSVWGRYDDTWGGDDLYSCDAARENDKNGPMRGFGKVWCAETDVFDQLGAPSHAEYGSGGSPPFSKVQLFQGGVMLFNPFGSEVFVLFNQGGWQRLPSY